MYTSVVAPGFTGPTMPSGSVQFLDGGKPVAACASVRLVAGSQASTAACKVTYKQAGAHRITVKYGGDGSFTGSASSPSQPVTVYGAGARDHHRHDGLGFLLHAVVH